MSLVKRNLDVTFQLGQGDFGTGGFDTVKLSGLRISAKVIKAGGYGMNTAQLQIYGMSLEKMNKLATLGMQVILTRKNTVTLEAGDEGSSMSTVFSGTIFRAWGNFESSPDVPFHVEAHSPLFESVAPVKPSSYTGATKVSDVMSALAGKMNLKFENNGVNTTLNSPYFWGAGRNQMIQAAEAAGIMSSCVIDDGTLAIWKPGDSRGGDVPTISAATGMRAYPAYTSVGIKVGTLFNPAIKYGMKIKVQSILTPANGEWVIYKLEHDLESNVPGGRWFTEIGAARPGSVVIS